uniref:Uncharacterized protein n=1 Tax=viral metagenome TaxID=1070528 RepID=A0A6H2A5Q5_9ZZZZ
MRTLTLSLEINGIERRSNIALYKEVIDENGEVVSVTSLTGNRFDSVIVTLSTGNQAFAKESAINSMIYKEVAYSLPE